MGELDPVIRAMVARGVAATRAIGEDLLGAAQREAPVEEGTLRGSGSVELDVRLDGVDVTVSFATPYAARQHEETTYEHPKGGNAKYLEGPLLQRAPRYQGVLARAIGEAL